MANFSVFIACSREQEYIRILLNKHLTPLIERGIIEVASEADIPAGEKESEVVVQYITQADTILLLLSADIYTHKHLDVFIRHPDKIIPVLVAECRWELHPKLCGIGNLVLPDSRWPIISAHWRDAEQACYYVEQALEQFFLPRISSSRRLFASFWIRTAACIFLMAFLPTLLTSHDPNAPLLSSLGYSFNSGFMLDCDRGARLQAHSSKKKNNSRSVTEPSNKVDAYVTNGKQGAIENGENTGRPETVDQAEGTRHASEEATPSDNCSTSPNKSQAPNEAQDIQSGPPTKPVKPSPIPGPADL